MNIVKSGKSLSPKVEKMRSRICRVETGNTGKRLNLFWRHPLVVLFEQIVLFTNKILQNANCGVCSQALSKARGAFF